MKFSAAFIAAASLYLSPLATAEDAETEAAQISRPQFTPTQLTAPFLEQFTDDWQTRWQASHAKKDTKGSEEEWQYVGEWSVEEPSVLKGMDGDKGLVAKNEAAHHAISAKFPKKIDPKGKGLVVQYEVKLQNGLECGGAYMKLLQDNKALKSEEFSNASPYVIMFGPDKCGSTNKVHFIFKHKNPKTKEYEEKHMEADTLSAKTDKLTNLYTLIVQPNNTYEVRVNGKKEQGGSLLEDFEPPVNPPKEIDDPDDKKPDDWVDTKKIPDPEAKKPDDWDEDEPYEIVDEEAEKPSDWLDDEPEMIPDPDAKKPDDWDDEEDGDWEPPQVPNPKCSEVSGCGKWERPTKKNPKYKGKWTPPYIDNPEYKGEWAPRKIPNPNYFEDKTPSNLEPIGGLGFEIWTMQSDIMFDNIYIGHSVEDAEKLQRETFDIKKPVEEKIEEANKPKEDEKNKPDLGEVTFKENPAQYVRNKLDQFFELVKEDPLDAVKTVPEVAGGLGILAVTVIALIIGSLGVGASSPKVQETAQKAKDKATEAKDKAAEAASTGAEKVQAEATKRTTRSSGS